MLQGNYHEHILRPVQSSDPARLPGQTRLSALQC